MGVRSPEEIRNLFYQQSKLGKVGLIKEQYISTQVALSDVKKIVGEYSEVLLQDGYLFECTFEETSKKLTVGSIRKSLGVYHLSLLIVYFTGYLTLDSRTV